MVLFRSTGNLNRYLELGEIANAGLGDGIGGAVQRIMEEFPPDTFYWANGSNPTTMVPYATFHAGKIIIDVKDDTHKEGGIPAIGVKPPEGSIPLDLSRNATVFDYRGKIFEIRHNTKPFYDK